MPKHDMAEAVMSRFLRCILTVLLGALAVGTASAAARDRVRVVYGFTGGTDGGVPEAGLVADATGAL
jgi:hypothetical protein